MIEFSTVYGRFYRSDALMPGRVIFSPRHRSLVIGDIIYYFSPLYADLINGVLVHNGSPGITIPASLSGIFWDVKVLPMGFSSVLQSYPGDIISLGD